MTLLASPLKKRLPAGLAGVLVVAGALGVGYWAGSARLLLRQAGRNAEPGSKVKSKASHVRSDGGTSLVPASVPRSGGRETASEPQSRGASSSPSEGEAQDEGDGEESRAMFAAMERLERQMAAGMARARDSVVALEYTSAEGPPGSRRMACGVVINSRGDLLSVRIDRPAPGPPATSAPASGGELAPIVARDASGRRHRANWVAADPESGLTLLQIPPRAVRPIQIAAEEPALGSQVIVVGNPLGLGHSVSRGHIAGLDRALQLGSRQLGGLIQVQAPLYPGDSGAAVANLRGQLLGLIRSGLAIPVVASERSDRDNDFGFAIAARDILWVADQLRARGYVDRAYIGVRLEPASAVPPSPAPHAQPEAGPDGGQPPASPHQGALLQDVIAGTPAALAGLQTGDFIVAVDGHPIRSSSDLTDRLDRLPSQAAIRFEVLRGQGGEQRQMTIELRTSSRPDSGPRQVALTPTPGPAATSVSISAPAQAAGSPSESADSLSARPDPPPALVPRPAAVPVMSVVPTAASVPSQGSGPDPKPGAAPVSVPAPASSSLRAPVAPPNPKR